MRYIAFVFSGFLVFTTAAQSTDPCLGLLEMRTSMDSMLSTNVGAVLDLDQQLLGYQSCLKTAGPDELSSYLMGLMDLAYVAYQRTDYQVAVEWSSRAVALLEHNSEGFDPDFRYNLLAEHGFYLYWKGNISGVKSFIARIDGPGKSFLQGLLLWTPRGNDWQQVDSLLDYSMAESQRLSPRLKSELVIWKAQNLLYSLEKRDWIEAERILLEQLQMAITQKDRIGEIWLRYQLGYWGRTTGNETVFAEQCRLLLAVNDRINLWPRNHPFRIRIINALAVASEGVGDMYTALLYIDEAIKYHREKEESLPIARRSLNKAKILRSLGRSDEAVEIYREIIPVFEEHNRSENRYSSLNNLANALSDLGQFTQAISAAKKALSLKIKDRGVLHDDVAISYLNLGQIYLNSGYADSASLHWNHAEDILSKLNRTQGVLPSVLFNSIGSLLMHQGRLADAEDYIRKSIAALVIGADNFSRYAVESLSFISAPLEMLAAQLNLARLNAKAAMTDPTRSHVADSLFLLCQDLLETVRFGLIHEQSKQALQKQAVAVYDEAIRFHLTREDEQQVEILFDLFEKSKSYALKNLVNAKTIASRYQIPDEIIKQEEELHREIDRLQKGILDQEIGNGQVANSNPLNFYEKQEDLREFQDKIRITYPSYYQEKYENKADSLSEIQHRLNKNEFVLNFHLLPNELLCLQIGLNSKRLIRFPIDTNFKKVVLSFLQILSDPQRPFSEFAAALQMPALYFMKEALAGIPDQSEIIIVPHQILATVPFELLLASTDPIDVSIRRNMPYLLRKYFIRYEYSASTISEGRSGILPVSYLGMAPMCCNDPLIPGQEQRLSTLPYSEEEVRNALVHWQGNVLLDAQATKNEFLDRAGEFSILHLASHAMVDQQEPLYRTRLAFFDDPSSAIPDLYAHELYQMDLGADLAVLSACNTGIGIHEEGEGMMSLARAFRFANCPNVITSLWSVNDRSTSRVMGLFFDFLADGSGISDALTKAKIQFLNTVPTESDYQLHPYYWSGFVAMGSNQIIAENRFSSYAWVYTGVLLILIGVSVWIWWRSRYA